MKGDFTRDTFRAHRRYWGVLRQQGRVDLDADWNEQVHIDRHEHRTRTTDLLGACGAPFANAGFAITAEDTTLRIGAGRYYVSGIRCDNDEATRFDDQPDPPGETPPDGDGVHLVYLDVWDRHVTALDDPLLREAALGGPDTATRARTVWQVRTQPLDPLSDELEAAIEAYLDVTNQDDASDEAIQAALEPVCTLVANAYCREPVEPTGGALDPDVGRLAARASDGEAGSDDPCRFRPQGGYQRLENRLYRVEIHRPGGADEATFKWSRDNGSVVVPVEHYGGDETDQVQVRRLGLDALTALDQGQYIEIIADDDELAGRPGHLVQIRNQPDADTRVLRLSADVEAKDLGLHPKVRRWDMDPEDDTDYADGQTVVADEWIELEDGVEIRFRDGHFQTGDYWLVPARTATADVEWPPYPTYPGESVDADPDNLPPVGIAHRWAPLAAVVRAGSSIVTTIDLRRRFPAATALHTLRYAGGDGQEPDLRDGRLPQPLQASVANGDQPVEGSLVRFEVLDGAGDLGRDPTVENAADTVTVPTDADGVASAGWRLDREAPRHRVRARLLDACGDPIGVPVFFNARVNYQLHYLSGDGQEGTPEDDLTLRPLRVWVSDGRWPLPGATVAFEVAEDSGTIDDPRPQTGSDGVAECIWTLDATTARQQVTARLLDSTGDAVHDAAIVFNATLRRAREVAYEPAKDCVTLREATTVQEALDTLCSPEPAFHVTSIRFGNGDTLRNDQLVPVSSLNSTIIVGCDGEVDPAVVHARNSKEAKPVCFVTLYLPFPFNRADMDLWGHAVLGTNPLRLQAHLAPEGKEIVWLPTDSVGSWLNDHLFTMMEKLQRGDRVLAYLTLKGNSIWDTSDPQRYLDGDVFGQLRGDGGTDAILPSGDRRRGGDLEVWFWLVRGEQCVDFRGLPEETEYRDSFTHQELEFEPLKYPLTSVTWGDPEGEMKLSFPPTGFRITFPHPVLAVRLLIGLGLSADVQITVERETETSQHSERINTETRWVTIPRDPAGRITALSVQGGEHEAWLVEVCTTQES